MTVNDVLVVIAQLRVVQLVETIKSIVKRDFVTKK